MKLISIYKKLLRKHGKQKWWPVKHDFVPAELEICIGAILTQNTNWRNVEKALQNLSDAGAVSAERIAKMRLSKLEKLIRPSGFYRQKAGRLKKFCAFVVQFNGNFYKDVTREHLLSLNGIGRETADSILLYACNKPFFVVDAYTRRLLSQEKIIRGSENYDQIRGMFEDQLPRKTKIYKEFHALIVQNGKILAERSSAESTRFKRISETRRNFVSSRSRRSEASSKIRQKARGATALRTAKR